MTTKQEDYFFYFSITTVLILMSLLCVKLYFLERDTVTVEANLVIEPSDSITKEVDNQPVVSDSTQTLKPVIEKKPTTKKKKSNTQKKKSKKKEVIIHQSTYEIRENVKRGDVAFDVIIVNSKKGNLDFFHKKNTGEKIRNIKTLKSYIANQSKKLMFATNGGMFHANHTPTGLYVENGKEIYPLNQKKGGAQFENFYDLPPNAVFCILKNNRAKIVRREDYHSLKNQVKHATQSAPMLIENSKINTELNPKSNSKYIRSGVGIKPDGRVVFAISKSPVTFYDFARIFKFYACKEALYLDGAISEMYLPEVGRVQSKNDFGLLIAITK